MKFRWWTIRAGKLDDDDDSLFVKIGPVAFCLYVWEDVSPWPIFETHWMNRKVWRLYRQGDENACEDIL